MPLRIKVAYCFDIAAGLVACAFAAVLRPNDLATVVVYGGAAILCSVGIVGLKFYDDDKH